jgi:hypothetical protein
MPIFKGKRKIAIFSSALFICSSLTFSTILASCSKGGGDVKDADVYVE